MAAFHPLIAKMIPRQMLLAASVLIFEIIGIALLT